MRLSTLFLFLFAWAGHGGIEAPRIGLWRDAQNRVRSLEGVGGSFVPGAVIRENVLAFAWFGDGGWLQTAEAIERLDKAGEVVDRYFLAPGAVQFAPTAVWVITDNAVLRWNGHSLQREPDPHPEEFALPVRIENGRLQVVRGGVVEKEFDWAPSGGMDCVEPLGSAWWHLRAGSHSFALRISPGREAIFEMPDTEEVHAAH